MEIWPKFSGEGKEGCNTHCTATWTETSPRTSEFFITSCQLPQSLACSRSCHRESALSPAPASPLSTSSHKSLLSVNKRSSIFISQKGLQRETSVFSQITDHFCICFIQTHMHICMLVCVCEYRCTFIASFY